MPIAAHAIRIEQLDVTIMARGTCEPVRSSMMSRDDGLRRIGVRTAVSACHADLFKRLLHFEVLHPDFFSRIHSYWPRIVAVTALHGYGRNYPKCSQHLIG